MAHRPSRSPALSLLPMLSCIGLAVGLGHEVGDCEIGVRIGERVGKRVWQLQRFVQAAGLVIVEVEDGEAAAA
jgi:hypothetical protein